jgi:hypothetical protein
MSRQEPIEHAYRLVADRHQSALPGAFASGLVRAPLLRGGAMWLVRDEPQRRVREPMAQGATPHVGERRELADTRAAFAAPDSEPGPFDERLARRVLVDIANGGQHSRGRGFAHAWQLQKELEGSTRLQ